MKNSLAEFAVIFVENLSFQWGEIKIMPTRINHSSVFFKKILMKNNIIDAAQYYNIIEKFSIL